MTNEQKKRPWVTPRIELVLTNKDTSGGAGTGITEGGHVATTMAHNLCSSNLTASLVSSNCGPGTVGSS